MVRCQQKVRPDRKGLAPTLGIKGRLPIRRRWRASHINMKKRNRGGAHKPGIVACIALLRLSEAKSQRQANDLHGQMQPRPTDQ